MNKSKESNGASKCDLAKSYIVEESGDSVRGVATIIYSIKVLPLLGLP